MTGACLVLSLRCTCRAEGFYPENTICTTMFERVPVLTVNSMSHTENMRHRSIMGDRLTTRKAQIFWAHRLTTWM